MPPSFPRQSLRNLLSPTIAILEATAIGQLGRPRHHVPPRSLRLRLPLHCSALQRESVDRIHLIWPPGTSRIELVQHARLTGARRFLRDSR